MKGQSFVLVGFLESPVKNPHFPLFTTFPPVHVADFAEIPASSLCSRSRRSGRGQPCYQLVGCELVVRDLLVENCN
jgi:hypothetical protein